MCGVWGFYGSQGAGNLADGDVIAKIGLANEAQRGGHAWGLAWVKNNRLFSFREPGKIDADKIAAMADGAEALIGHTRLATHGKRDDNINNHPHPVDGGWLVHNGCLRDYDTVVKSFTTWEGSSACDTELLGMAYTQSLEDCDHERAEYMLKFCQPTGTSPLVVLALWKDRLVMVKQGNPLHQFATEGKGTYLSSIHVDGPWGGVILKDNMSWVYNFASGWTQKDLIRPCVYVASYSPKYHDYTQSGRGRSCSTRYTPSTPALLTDKEFESYEFGHKFWRLVGEGRWGFDSSGYREAIKAKVGAAVAAGPAKENKDLEALPAKYKERGKNKKK